MFRICHVRNVCLEFVFLFLKFSVCNFHFAPPEKIEKQVHIVIRVFMVSELSLDFTNVSIEVSK